MGVFSLEEYNIMTGKMGMAMWAFFLGCVGTLSFAVYSTYPDRPSAPRTFEGGLEEELGGPGALRVSSIWQPLLQAWLTVSRPTSQVTKRWDPNYRSHGIKVNGRRNDFSMYRLRINVSRT